MRPSRLRSLFPLFALLLTLTACNAPTPTISTTPAPSQTTSPTDDVSPSPSVSLQDTLATAPAGASWAQSAQETEVDVPLSGDTAVNITEAGTYRLHGTLTNGGVFINAPKAAVTLILAGAHINNQIGAAIYAPNGKTITIVLEGENTLTDGGGQFVYSDTEAEEPNACLFVKNDLIIQGDGSLTVNASFHNGIAAKDTLTVNSGNITIEAAYHAIRAKDGATVNSGTLNLTSKQDGIHTAADFLLTDGDITINAGDDGIHAGGTLTVDGGGIDIQTCYEGLEGYHVVQNGGDVTIHSTDDGVNASAAGTAEQNDRPPNGGGFPPGDNPNNMQLSATAPTAESSTTSDQPSIIINGGTLTIYAQSDGFDANGTLTITGGTTLSVVNNSRDGDPTDTDYGGTIAPGVYVVASVAKGTAVTVGDVWSGTFEDPATSFFLSVPGMTQGTSYTVTADGKTLATVTGTTTIEGMMQPNGTGHGRFSS